MRATMTMTKWLAIGLGLVAYASGEMPGHLALAGSNTDATTVGKELFQREWVADDPRSRGGDGLGPVYNATSCAACHSQGGPGGGGLLDSNVEILTPVATPGANQTALSAGLLAKRVRDRTGLRTVGSIVLHKYGTDPHYQAWRNSDQTRGRWAIGFAMRSSSRNTPALFGVGLIDAIPSEVIEAQEEPRGVTEFPEIHGRVGRVAGGKVGRFGWKAQTETLKEFVLTACSVELGLEVPGHSQSPNPLAPDDKAPGLDLTAVECNALVAYVGSLPAPGRRVPFNHTQKTSIAAGAKVFESIGCAACHLPKLGNAEGIYSDLLLHDMGDSLSDVATYYGAPVSPGQDIVDPLPGPLVNGQGTNTSGSPPASRQEWRTPPLWGVRDSAPYLHDGRAATLDIAIMAHDGEAKLTAQRYDRLSKIDRIHLHAFLMSLTAPQLVKDGEGRKGGSHGVRRVSARGPSFSTTARF